MKSSVCSARKQRGFTLIEIAIVLVIIGLLVGGILQGQELIESSRVKQAVRDINSTAAAVFSYQDRYGTMPGDDRPVASLTARGTSWTSAGAGAAGGLPPGCRRAGCTRLDRRRGPRGPPPGSRTRCAQAC